MRDAFLYGQILDPLALLQHESAQGDLCHVGALAEDVQRHDGKVREPAQAEGQRHADYPHIAAVEEEGHEGLTAGAEGEIGAVVVGMAGHCRSVDADALDDTLYQCA